MTDTGEAGKSAGSAPDGEKTDEEKVQDSEEAGQEQRPPAWAARLDLIEHSPVGLASVLVEGAQYGMAGGEVHGDVIYQFGAYAEPRPLSGEIPADDVARLSMVFTEGPRFAEALIRLREERVLVLTGSRATGRSSAGLMLLHRLGLGQIRLLPSDTPPAAVRDELDCAAGYLLADIAVSRNRPLQQVHLHAIREQLTRSGGHLVITVAESASYGELASLPWEPPLAMDVLASHVRAAEGVAGWDRVRGLTAVDTFLERDHPPGEAAAFAGQLVAVAAGTAEEASLVSFGETTVQTQIESWLTGKDFSLHDRAFLVSLGVFDDAPYAVAAELADGLFTRLQQIESPYQPSGVAVFGSSRSSRLDQIRARGYEAPETTVWGAVPQYMATFRDGRVAPQLLDTVWMLYPSARPALVGWLRELAADGRPLVRTRASAAAALLTRSDLSSGLAHLIEPWADSRSYTARLAAANALTLAHLLHAVAIPQILHTWCTGDDENRRWTAIRAYGLLGPVLPDDALQALTTAAREYCRKEEDRRKRREKEEESEELRELVEAIQLLLLAARGPVLAKLVLLVEQDRAVSNPAIGAFLLACEQPVSEADDRPLVLDWYRTALQTAPCEAQQLTRLWGAALEDPRHTGQAVLTLRAWVGIADRVPEAEAALTVLLPGLAQYPSHHRRLEHLLRTVWSAERGFRLPVADRLLACLPH
ncbi:hypothetical protein G3I19_14910 [Streptomyces sp. SID10853]|uniref:hypothetical protein n=1 Tax=Streptomyces sp. SID10853 TaxID=2706028 RepID=UPI0013C0CF67|nr:hypothetical protein [Streptomyces sp. SID10853]NDZ79775.1 hypothetical protein [Streptomyces sp. SID10853]